MVNVRTDLEWTVLSMTKTVMSVLKVLTSMTENVLVTPMVVLRTNIAVLHSAVLNVHSGTGWQNQRLKETTVTTDGGCGSSFSSLASLL